MHSSAHYCRCNRRQRHHCRTIPIPYLCRRHHPCRGGDLKPEAAASSSEEAVATATAIVTARLAELEAEIARATRDVAALTGERRDLQERINALSGQTLEASQRLSKLRGSVPSTENETPGRQHLVPVAQPSTSIGQAKVGG